MVSNLTFSRGGPEKEKTAEANLSEIEIASD